MSIIIKPEKERFDDTRNFRKEIKSKKHLQYFEVKQIPFINLCLTIPSTLTPEMRVYTVKDFSKQVKHNIESYIKNIAEYLPQKKESNFVFPSALTLFLGVDITSKEFKDLVCHVLEIKIKDIKIDTKNKVCWALNFQNYTKTIEKKEKK